MKYDVRAGVFYLTKTLAAGNYQFKFIMDGKWLVSRGLPTTMDASGTHLSNIIAISEGNCGPTVYFPIAWTGKHDTATARGSLNDWSATVDLRRVSETGSCALIPTVSSSLEYKFLVDNKWSINEASSTSGHGVLSITQSFFRRRLLRRRRPVRKAV